ncbi:hypothetical protein V8E54_011790 [Elaphomyces granulatus]
MAPRSSSPSSSNPSYASDEQESTYLTRTRILHQIRLGIAVLILAVATAVVGCEGAPLYHYNQTASFERLWLTLWPLNLDVRQTNALLACGSVIAFQALVYIIVALLPSPHPRTKLLNFLATITAGAGLVTAVVGVIFAVYLPSATYPSGFTQNETIHSWTCKWRTLEANNVTGQDGQPLHAPAGFSRDCIETRVGFVLLGLLIGIEAIMGAASAAGWFLERTVSKQRRVEQVELGKN